MTDHPIKAALLSRRRARSSAEAWLRVWAWFGVFSTGVMSYWAIYELLRWVL